MKPPENKQEETKFATLFQHFQTQLCRLYCGSYPVSSIGNTCLTQLLHSPSKHLTWAFLHLSTEHCGRLLSLTQPIQCDHNNSDCEDTVRFVYFYSKFIIIVADNERIIRFEM